MEDIFKIDERFDLHQDSILKYVHEISNSDFIKESGLDFTDNRKSESNPKAAKNKLQEPKYQYWGILESKITAIRLEKTRLVKLIEDFYLTSVDEYVYRTSNMSPQKIQHILNKLLIRLKRLELVLNPDYSITKYDEKRNNKNYSQIKGYWINADGKRVRSISRSIGKTLSEDEEIAMKLLDVNTNKETKVTLLRRGAESIADLRVNDGNTIWLVELKSDNRPILIRNYVMFENWKIYKKEYKLLE